LRSSSRSRTDDEFTGVDNESRMPPTAAGLLEPRVARMPSTVNPVPPKLLVRKLVGVAGAITAGVALSRFTRGDWISGLALSASVGWMCAWYLLSLHRPRDKRRY